MSLAGTKSQYSRMYKYQEILEKYARRDTNSPLLEFLQFSQHDFPTELASLAEDLILEVTGVQKTIAEARPIGLRRQEALKKENRDLRDLKRPKTLPVKKQKGFKEVVNKT